MAKKTKVKNENVIKIQCKGSLELPLSDLNYFQDDLKVLSEENYLRLKENLKENGFSEPISVWQHDGKYFILNGHQRYTAIKRMVNSDGFTIEGGMLQCSLVLADDIKTAKKKVLALTSEYGKITKEGFASFVHGADIDPEYLRNVINIQSIDVEEIIAGMGDRPEINLEDKEDLNNIDNTPESGQGEQIGMNPDDKPRNDVMTGLRLLQVFLTDAELSDFKKKADAVQEYHGYKNVTETIINSVNMAYENLKVK